MSSQEFDSRKSQFPVASSKLVKSDAAVEFNLGALNMPKTAEQIDLMNKINEQFAKVEIGRNKFPGIKNT